MLLLLLQEGWFVLYLLQTPAGQVVHKSVKKGFSHQCQRDLRSAVNVGK